MPALSDMDELDSALDALGVPSLTGAHTQQGPIDDLESSLDALGVPRGPDSYQEYFSPPPPRPEKTWLTPDERLAAEQASLEGFARGHLARSSMPNTEAALTGLGTSVLAPIARFFEHAGKPSAADAIQRYGEAFETVARERDQDNKIIPPIVSRAARGVAKTLPQSVVAGHFLGPTGAIGVGVLQEQDQAITEARDAGLSDDEVEQYARNQGLIEGGVAGAFQAAGLGGLEKILGGQAKQAASSGIKQAIKETLKSTFVEELPEELLTEVSHSLARKLHGVDPNALTPENLFQVAADTTVQTLMTMGLAEAPNIAQTALETRKRRLGESQAAYEQSIQDELRSRFDKLESDYLSEQAKKDKLTEPAEQGPSEKLTDVPEPPTAPVDAPPADTAPESPQAVEAPQDASLSIRPSEIPKSGTDALNRRISHLEGMDTLTPGQRNELAQIDTELRKRLVAGPIMDDEDYTLAPYVEAPQQGEEKPTEEGRVVQGEVVSDKPPEPQKEETYADIKKRLDVARERGDVTMREISQGTEEYRGRGGISSEAGGSGFRAAFRDSETGEVAMPVTDLGGGRLAQVSIHIFDGLPDSFVTERNQYGEPIAVKGSVEAGFVRDGKFYTREEAAEAVQAQPNRIGQKTPQVEPTTEPPLSLTPVSGQPVGPKETVEEILGKPEAPPVTGKRLYRETNIDELDALLPNSNTTRGHSFGPPATFLTDNPDLALGQGGNKGYLLEFDSGSLPLAEHAKPGTAVPGVGKEFTTRVDDSELRKHLVRVTIKKDAPAGHGMRIRVRDAMKKLTASGEWVEAKNEDGSVTFSRKDVAEQVEAPTDPLQAKYDEYVAMMGQAKIQPRPFEDWKAGLKPEAVPAEQPKKHIGKKVAPEIADTVSGNTDNGQKVADDGVVQTIAGKMDLDEFEKKGYAPEQVTREDWVNLQRANRRKLGQPEESGTPHAPYADYEEYHRDAVRQALERGEEVDEQVLEDYTDLQPEPPKKKIGQKVKQPESDNKIDYSTDSEADIEAALVAEMMSDDELLGMLPDQKAQAEYEAQVNGEEPKPKAENPAKKSVSKEKKPSGGFIEVVAESPGARRERSDAIIESGEFKDGDEVLVDGGHFDGERGRVVDATGKTFPGRIVVETPDGVQIHPLAVDLSKAPASESEQDTNPATTGFKFGGFINDPEPQAPKKKLGQKKTNTTGGGDESHEDRAKRLAKSKAIVLVSIYGQQAEAKVVKATGTLLTISPLGEFDALENQEVQVHLVRERDATAKKTIKEKASDARQEYQDALDDAFKDIRDAGLGMNQALNPKVVVAVAKVAAKALKAGVLTFADFVNDFSQQLGREKIPALREYLQRAWSAAVKLDKSGTLKGEDYDAFFEGYNNERVVDGTKRLGGRKSSAPGGAATSGDAAGSPGQGSGDVSSTGGRVDSETADSDGGGESGAATGGTSATSSDEADETEQRGEKPAAKVQKRNHRIGPSDSLTAGGPTAIVARTNANVEAIRILKDLEQSKRDATPEEMKAMAQYVGWGGLSQVFDTGHGEAMLRDQQSWYRDAGWEKTWGKFYRALKGDKAGEYTGLLTEEEWRNAAQSTEFAHYTSRDVIERMWDAAARLGFSGGKVLEPAAGVGHFFGLMPEVDAELVGVEIDSISGRLTKQLYPDATVFVQGLEDTKIPPNSIDLAISNVPFSASGPSDGKKRYGKKLNLHNYFLARMIDAVKPGGLVVAISTHNTMDSQTAQRKMLAEKAALVGAIRLPNNAFKKNANTDVVTDILFLRKNDGTNYAGEAWGDVAQVGTDKAPELDKQGRPTGKMVDTPIVVNEYFVKHPEMALGTHSLQGEMRREGEYTLQAKPGVLSDMMSAAIAKLPEGIMGRGATEQVDFSGMGKAEGIPNNTLQIKDGNLTLVQDGMFVSAGELHPSLSSPSPATMKQVKAYLALKDHYDSHLKLMRNESATDAQILASQKKLNTAYDSLVALMGKSGSISGLSGQKFRDEAGYYRLLGLERKRVERDPVTKKDRIVYEKSDVFRKRTIPAFSEPVSAGSLKEAVQVAIAFRGSLDLEHLANLTGSTPEQTADDLRNDGLAFPDPGTGMWVPSFLYLSGNVREKLAQAKLAAKDDKSYEQNVSALEKVQPEPVAGSSISMKLAGAHWVPDTILSRFAKSALKDPSLSIRYVPATDKFYVTGDKWSVGAREDYSVLDTNESVQMDGLDILQAALNMRDIRIEKPRLDKDGLVVLTPAGNVSMTIDQEQTLKAQAVVQRFEAEFTAWAKSQEDVMIEVQRAFNDKYNFWVRTQYDPDFLAMPSANPNIQLRPYQKAAVVRLLMDGHGMLAHGVGSGKTYEAIAWAIEGKRLGLHKKPMIAVHNITLSQYAEAVANLYPGANVYVATKNDLASGKRKAFMARIAANDYDLVILPHSSFNLIPNDPVHEEAYIHEQLDELEEIIRETKRKEGKSDPSVKDLEKSKRALQDRLKDLLKKMKERSGNDLYFEQMGIDGLLVDEAHEFKKPPFVTKLGRIKGLDKQTSQRAAALTLKMRAVRNMPGNRGVRGTALATGTPVTNTLSEAWHMLRLASPHLLAEFGADTFDRFVGTFSSVENVLEQNAGGTWRYYQTLARFRNGFSLGQLLGAGWDIMTSEELVEFFKSQGEAFPELEGGAPQDVTVPQTAQVQTFNDWLKDIFNAWSELSGQEKKMFSWVPVQVYLAGKAAAMDMRMVRADAKDDPGSKVNTAVNKVYEIYQKTASEKGTQAVFADTMNRVNLSNLAAFASGAEVEIDFDESSPSESDDGDSTVSDETAMLYSDFKRKLVKLGIPESEVALISDYKKEADRKGLFERVNAGEVRVVIGGTKTLGTGANIQRRLAAIHNLDIPWTAADFVQRLGRGLRFGNLNKTIKALNYGMEGTTDSSIFGKILRKAAMMDQAMMGKLGAEFDDPFSDVVATAEEMMAAFAGDTRVFEQKQAEADARGLKLEKEALENRIARARERLSTTRRSLEEAKNQQAAWEALLPTIPAIDMKAITATVNGQPFSGDRKALLEMLDTMSKTSEQQILSLTKQGKVGKITHSYDYTDKHIAAEVQVGPVTMKLMVGYSQELKKNDDGKGLVADWKEHKRVFVLTPRPKGTGYGTDANLNLYDGSATTPMGGLDALADARKYVESQIGYQKNRQPGQLRDIDELSNVLKQEFPADKEERLRVAQEKSDRLKAELEESGRAEDAARKERREQRKRRGDGGGAGVQALHSSLRQSRSTGASKDSDTEAGIAAADIIKTMERIFNVPLRVGGFSRRASGIYKVLPEVVRLKENHYGNLAVAAHEVAHHIDKQTDASDNIPEHLQGEVSGLDYEPKNRLFEGWAEFIRHYITETDADRVAPEFHKWFTGTWLPENPRWAKPIEEARQMARQYADQSVFQRVRALIKDRVSGSPQDTEAFQRYKRQVNSRAVSLYRTWVDRFSALHTVQKAWREKSEAQGLDQSKEAGVYDAAMAYDQTAGPNAAMALEKGVHRLTDDKVIGPSLWALREHLEQGEYDEAIVYAYARHTLYESERNPGFNTGLDLEDAKAILDDTSNEKAARFEKFASGLATYNNALLDMAVDAGALNADDRDRMVARYGDHYFPLFRVPDGGQEALPGAGTKLVNLPKIVRGRSRKGSGRQIIDPFDATVSKTIFFYGRAAKARVIHKLVEATVPQFGAPDGMGGFVDKIDPKSMVHRGVIDEILDTLVQQGVVEEADARAMRVAARIREGMIHMVSQSDMDAFLDRHGLDATAIGGEDFDAAVMSEPDALATISLWRPNFTPNAKKSTVLYHDQKGQPHLLEVDGELYRAVTGMDDVQFYPFLKVFQAAAYVMKAGSVTLNTGFGVKNLIRDYMEYQGRSTIPGMESLSKPVEMLARYVAYKAQQMAGKPVNDPLIEEFEKGGGKLYNILGDSPSRQRVRKRRLGKSNTDSAFTLGDIRDLSAGGVDALAELIAVSDAPPRLAEMEAEAKRLGYEARRGENGGWYDIETGRKVDLSESAKIRIMNAAAEATVNFKRSGSWGRAFNAYVPFFNATLQASLREARLIKNLRRLGDKSDADAAARRYLLYLSIMASVGVVTYLMRGDDDDWKEQEDWEREQAWTWGTNGRTYWKIPKPRDAGGLVTNFTETLLDSMSNKDRDGVLSELSGVVGRHGADRVPDPVPGGLGKGTLEVLADQDYFRGRPLTPDHLKEQPKALQFTPYTLETSRAIGRATSNFGMSPIQFEHMLNSSTGGAYRRHAGALEAAYHGEAGPQNLPFVSGVYTNRHQTASIDDFYAQRDLVGVQLKWAEHIKDEAQIKALSQEKMRLSDTAELLTAIRSAEKKDLRGRRSGKYDHFLVGLAREAMGREAMVSNPSPFDKGVEVPDEIKAVLAKFAEGKAKTAVLSSGMPDQKKDESAEVYKARLDKWEAGREYDEKWLKAHKDSQPVREALLAARKSKSFVNMLQRKDQPQWPSGARSWQEHQSDTKRWMTRVNRAREWLDELRDE